MTALVDQREAIASTIEDGGYAGAVHRYPLQGQISPPCVVIGQPSFQFDAGNTLAMVGWLIDVYVPRTAQESVSVALDDAVQTILFALRKGAGIGLALQNVYPASSVELSGYEFETYQISATTTLPNC